MIKKLLATAVGCLPRSVRLQVSDSYWRAKSRLLYQSLYKLLELKCTLSSGINLQVESKGEWWVYNDIFVNGEYDVPILEVLEKWVPNRRSSVEPLTVLDLGANVGYFALRVVDLLRQRHPGCRINFTMVEASPKILEELEARMHSQNMPEVSLRMVQGLAGKRTGSALLQESALHVKSTIMNDGNRQGQNIQFIDLSMLMEREDEIDLLKCDIEGAELMFLENYGDLMAKVKNAVFEFHHEMCNTEKCRELLLKSGFRETVLRANTTFSISFMTRD